MRESTIQTNICEYAKSLNWKVFKFKDRGDPDRLFLRNAIMFFIEFKAPNKKPTKLQKKVIKEIQDEKFDVYLIDSILEGKKIIDKYDKM